MNYNLVTILGPTACGKTRLGALLAADYHSEIISADSRQVYKHMDIGTGKDLHDYDVNGELVPFHLIDIIEPAEEYSLFNFQMNFSIAFNEISNRKKMPLLVGGTGMYLSSVLESYNLKPASFDSGRYDELASRSIESLRETLLSLSPSLHNTTDLMVKERIIKAIIIAESGEQIPPLPEIKSLNIGIRPPREAVKKRITERLRVRLEGGMIQEAENLLASGITYEKLAFFGLEYKYLSLYLQKKLTFEQLFEQLNTAIHQFSKRQMTWFRRMEKHGIVIHWIHSADYALASEILKQNLINE
jgi:tRNA dimethylallyltransferase